MSQVTGILAQVVTGDVDGAGTDGRVFLGLGGREFRLDSREDDYERASWREYVLGRGPLEPNLPAPQIRVQNPDENDPRRHYAVDSLTVTRTPVYLRFEPEGNRPDWNLSFAAVLVYEGEGHFVAAYTLPRGFQDLWLGDSYGKVVRLPDAWWRDERTLLEVGRARASRVVEGGSG